MKRVNLIALVVLLVLIGACLKKTYQQVEIKFLDTRAIFNQTAQVKIDFGECLQAGDTVWICCDDGKSWQVVEHRSFLVNARGKVVVRDGRHYSRAIIVAKLD